MRTAIAIALVAVAALFAASEATFTFMADYQMFNNESYPNAFMTGKVYYHYVAADPLACRLRFDTQYVDLNGQVQTHSELYHYQNGGVYTICSHCDAAVLEATLEPWKMFEGEACESEGDGYYRCIKGTMSLKEIVTKGDPETAGSGFDIKYVRLDKGRELYLKNLQMINYADYTNKFEIGEDEGCPQPVCRSYVDVVFVLDASGSVSSSEWTQVKNFLKKAAKHFNVGPYDAHIGIVEFTAPTPYCCKNYPNCNGNYQSWSSVCCSDSSLKLRKRTNPTRYLDDCVFDLRCDNVTGNTAKIMFNLTYENVDTKVSGIKRISGGTCQRYGLVKAYDMLFGTYNPRCADQSGDRRGCPTPVVIAVTDGADYCHASTEAWANRIKERGGILLEVGVGFDYDFDREYIENLSSRLGGNTLALNVNDYAHIESVLERMVKPVCSIGQSSGGSCGVSCKGFCACGDCVCPNCLSEASSICQEYVCVNHSAENGCWERDVFCEVETDDPKCYNAICDATTGDPSTMCKAVPVDCDQVLGLKKCQYSICYDGCNESRVYVNHSYCQEVIQENCIVGMCDPDNEDADPVTGCIRTPKDCSTVNWANLCKEGSITCNPDNGECEGEECTMSCFSGDNYEVPKCRDIACKVVTCDPNAEDEKDRCIVTDRICEDSPNNCMTRVCHPDVDGCIEVPKDKLNCSDRNRPDGCKVWSCDANAVAEDGVTMGACVFSVKPHEADNCTVFTCEDDGWHVAPKCPTTKACKVNRCNKDLEDENCYEVDVECRGKVKIPNKCFQAACKEPDGCYKKQYRGAYFDVCGNCIRQDDLDSSDESLDLSSEEYDECAVTSEEELPTEGLAAAAVALIVVGAILIGATIAISSIVGTKALIERARGASNQSAVNNPMFEDSHKEMSNPVFEETEDAE